MSLKVVWNDITREKTDVIVTPASRKNRIGTGVDAVIHQIGGQEFTKARLRLGGFEPGKVLETPAFGLHKTTGARYVIHALGPLWEGGDRHEDFVLRYCYQQILCKVIQLKCKTVTIPVLSAGRFGMPFDAAVDIAVETIDDFLQSHPNLDVKIVAIDSNIIDYVRAQYNEGMVESRFTREEEDAYRAQFPVLSVARMEDVETGYFSPLRVREFERKFWEDVKGKTFKNLFNRYYDRFIEENRLRYKEDIAEEEDRTSRKLTKAERMLIEEEYALNYRGVARRSGISERNLKHYHNDDVVPKREDLIALAVILKVSPLELEAMMKAGDLPVEGPNAHQDDIIREFLRRRTGSVIELNCKLRSLNLPAITTARTQSKAVALRSLCRQKSK